MSENKMKQRFFISYRMFDGSTSGHGCYDAEGTGLHSWGDVLNAAEKIEEMLVEKHGYSENTEVVIINWRKYDPPE